MATGTTNLSKPKEPATAPATATHLFGESTQTNGTRFKRPGALVTAASHGLHHKVPAVAKKLL
jgi:hypothetical protein